MADIDHKRGDDTEVVAETAVVSTYSDGEWTMRSRKEREEEPAPTYREGAKLGRYVIVQEAGKGGMARVLRAYDPRLRREVALKVLLHAGTEDDRARIIREARAMAQLNHPNVVNVYDVEEDTDPKGASLVFVAMEYVPGQSLRYWLEERRPWREVVAAFIQIGQALAAAHGVGLVHRDVKPANILVGDDGRIRVTDFGLARAEVLGEAPAAGVQSSIDTTWDLELTREGTVAGTPAYMAPEQHAGATADPRSDQYAFCVALWQGLYGSRPFHAPNLIELIKCKRRGPPAPPSPSLPRWLHAAVARGMAADSAARWPSMDALLAALQADPSRRRQRIAAAVLALVAVTTAYGAYRVAGQRERDACAAEGASIDEVWGDAARQEVEQAFTAAASPLAETAWAQARPWLDRYANRWAELRTESCIATEVDHTRAPDLDALAVACLNERRDALAALVAVLAQADDVAIRNAVAASSSLPRLDVCADAAKLRLLPLPPEGEEARRELTALRERAARAQSLLATGRSTDALELTDALLPDAEQFGWEPIVARVLYIRGSALEELGRFDDAAAALEDALLRAGTAGADLVAGRAATGLIMVDGVRRARVEDGLRWARLAQMHLQRSGEGEGIHEAARLVNLGLVLDGMGDYAEAEADLRRALELTESSVGVEHPRAGGALDALGSVLDDAGSFDEAVQVYARALELRERTLGPDHPYVGTSLNNLANMFEQRGEHERSLELYERAAKIWRNAYPKDHPHIAVALNNLGNVHRDLGDLDQAEAELGEAVGIWERTQGEDHPNVMMGLSNLATLRKAQGDLPGARELQERVLGIAERARGKDHVDYGIALMNLASILSDAGDLDRAADRYEEAKTTLERSVGPDHPHVSYVFHGLGSIAMSRSKPAAAVPLFEAALAIRTSKTNDPDLRAESRFRLADALWKVGTERTRAVQLARQSLDELQAQARRSAAGDELVEEIEGWLNDRPVPPGG